MYLIKQAASLSGVSVRTLHHYDRIGLLVPKKSDNGYRYYDEADLSRLQLILYYKRLNFSLKEIQALLDETPSDLLSHLTRQLSLLEKERGHLDLLIDTLKKIIQEKKGEIKMTTAEKFVGFTYQDHVKYKQGAIDKYGQTIVEASYSKQRGHEAKITESFNQVFRGLAKNKAQGLPVTDEDNQALIDKLYHLVCRYGFDCSLPVFGEIGKTYVENPAFQQNIDRFGVGLAQYTADSIAVYVRK